MLCPRSLAMPNQPIALNDVLTYLPAAKDMAHGENRIFEIGGTGVSTNREVIREYARQRRLLSRAGDTVGMQGPNAHARMTSMRRLPLCPDSGAVPTPLLGGTTSWTGASP